MRLRELAIAVLLDNGFPPPLAGRSYATLAHYVLGFAMQLGGPDTAAASPPTGLADVDPAQFPATAAAAASLPVALEDEFTFGLELLINGLGSIHRGWSPRKLQAYRRLTRQGWPMSSWVGGESRQLLHLGEELALPTYAGYSATKGPVDAISLVLAKELRGRNIPIIAVAPGLAATALFLDGKDQQTIDRVARMNPLEQLGTPADIA
jgi:hypothetical protein